jgi:hypothetical protein
MEIHPRWKFQKIESLIQNQMSARDEYILEDCPGNPRQFISIFADRSLPSKLSETLSKAELRALIVGLVKFDVAHEGRAYAGSATPIAGLYYKFAELYPDDEQALTEWIVKNRANDYDPFGTIVCNDVLSLGMHRAYFEGREAARKRRESYVSEWQSYQDGVRKDLKAIEGNKNLPGAIARGDISAVTALIKNGASLDSVEKSTGMSPIQLALTTHRGDMAVFLFNTYYQ